MEVVDTAQINSFAPIAEQTNFVQTSEEAVFILTAGQLKDLISQAIQPLQDEFMELRATAAAQDEKIAALQATQETQADNSLIQLRLINDLRETKKGPGKTEISRAEKIEKYLSSRPDHRANFETLKGHLGIDKVLLNQTVKILMASSPGRYGIARTPDDKRKRTLVMLPK